MSGPDGGMPMGPDMPPVMNGEYLVLWCVVVCCGVSWCVVVCRGVLWQVRN